MTKAKPISESKRPRRFLGQTLRETCRCPLCAGRDLRVVAFRRRVARMECSGCQLRFSIDLTRFCQAFVNSPDLIRDADPAGWAFIAVVAAELEPDDLEGLRRIIEDAGTQAFVSHLQALGPEYVERLARMAEESNSS